ncbi:MAG: tetratricopeptide repeat protein [Sulfuricellaceae bacterium]
MRSLLNQFRSKPLPLLVCGAFALSSAAPAFALAPSSVNEAEIISIIGKGDARASAQEDWKPAAVKQHVTPGSFVRTRDLSQMALLLQDQTQLRLNQNSMVQIKEISAKGETTKLELTTGRVWAQAKRKSFSFFSPSQPPAVTVQTPNAIAAIRGTDWELVVDKDGAATLTVLSGEVDFYNDLGRVAVHPNEQAHVEPGKAPTKVLLTNARERVQWVTAYRPQPSRWLPAAQPELKAAADAIESGNYADALKTLKTLESRDKSDAGAALLLADLYISFGRVPEAIGLLERHVGEPRAAALLARAYLISDRAIDAGKILTAAHARHPADVEILLAQGDLARFNGDAGGAKKAFRQALKSDEKNADGWFGVGRVEAEREAVKEGRAALDRAIGLNPAGAGYKGELATLESFANEFASAEKAFNDALAQQPDDYVALTGLGILQLKRGDPDAALEYFLKSGVVEPRYARGALYTGVAYYQLGNPQRATEMFRRAAELDPKDPMPYMMMSLVAADRLELGEAVQAARRASELMPYLKSLNQLLNNQKGNANVGASLAQFGMEDWAQAYAYNAYTPYWAGSHLFLADRYSGTFNKNSELFKGFLSDPTVFGASNRFNTLVASPGNYFNVGGRLTSQDIKEQALTLGANGYSVSTIPFTYFLSTDQARIRPDRTDMSVDGQNYTLGLGAKPSHELGLFAFANNFSMDGKITALNQGLSNSTLNLDNSRTDGGINYKFSPTSHLWLKFGTGKEEDRFGGNYYLPEIAGLYNRIFGDGVISPNGKIDRYTTTTDQDDGQLRHTFDATNDWQVSWGLETTHQDKRIDAHLALVPIYTSQRGDDKIKSDEAYVSNRIKLHNSLLLQADLSYAHVAKQQWWTVKVTTTPIETFAPDYDMRRLNLDITEWNPRLGFAWNPVQNQTLRLAAQQWRRPASVSTLAPVDTAGIAVDDRLVSLGGELKRLRVQYEWEIGNSTFAQGYLDKKQIHNLAKATGTLVGDLNLEDLERLRNRNRLSPQALDFLEGTPEFGAADVESAGFALNRLLAQNLSGNFRYQYNHSNNTGNGYQGNRVPWLPRHLVSIGANWLPLARWQLGATLTHRSQRYTDEANTQQLNAGWNLGLRSYWESLDKRTSFEVIAENLHSDKDAAPTRSAVLGAQGIYRF